MIVLEVPATGLDDGWQDPETLIIHYDPIKTPHGPLGNLKVRDSQILEAADVALISKIVLIDVVPDAYGIRTLTVAADNGEVKYRILDDDLEWSDRPGEPVNFRLGLLQSSDWSE